MSNLNEQEQQERKKELNAKYANAKRNLKNQVIHILTLDKIVRLFPDNNQNKVDAEDDLRLAKALLVSQYMSAYEKAKKELELYTDIRPNLTSQSIIYDTCMTTNY